MTARWMAYWIIWRPMVDLTLGLLLGVAECLARVGIYKIGRIILIDMLMQLEERTWPR